MSATVVLTKTVSILEDFRSDLLSDHQEGQLSVFMESLKSYLRGVLMFELGYESHEENCLDRIEQSLDEYLELVQGKTRDDAEDQLDELLSYLEGVSPEERSSFYREQGIEVRLMSEQLQAA